MPKFHPDLVWRVIGIGHILFGHGIRDVVGLGDPVFEPSGYFVGLGAVNKLRWQDGAGVLASGVAWLNKGGKSGESDSPIKAGLRARGSQGMW